MPEREQTRSLADEYVVPSGRERAPRRRLLGAVVVMAAVAAAVAAVAGPRLTDGSDGQADVAAGPAAELPPIPTSLPLPPRVELEVPPGWKTLLADGERLVVATTPLDPRDLLLAVLAREDAVFSAFPPTAAVFVVGGDRLVAKYFGAPPHARVSQVVNGVEIVGESVGGVVGPGPARALGPPVTLDGGVVVRRGDLPQSSSTLAAYVGPQASTTAMQEAMAMAAAVRLQPYDGAMIPPPPPGSRPGFDQGGVDVAESDLVPVATVAAGGVTYTARAHADCAEVMGLVGGCRPRPAEAGVEVVASGTALGPPPPPPGESYGPGVVLPPESTMIVLARVGSDATEVTAVLVDGRSVDGAVGDDGWAVVATEGRVFLLEARDGDGTVVARGSVV